MIYNVERADQPDITQPLGAAPLTTEWRRDLLQGVAVIKGSWTNGSAMLAIPNYARNNRTSQQPEARDVGAGNAALDYSGAAGGSGNANAATSAPTGRSGRGVRAASSMVWIRDQ